MKKTMGRRLALSALVLGAITFLSGYEVRAAEETVYLSGRRPINRLVDINREGIDINIDQESESNTYNFIKIKAKENEFGEGGNVTFSKGPGSNSYDNYPQLRDIGDGDSYELTYGSTWVQADKKITVPDRLYVNGYTKRGVVGLFESKQFEAQAISSASGPYAFTSTYIITDGDLATNDEPAVKIGSVYIISEHTAAEGGVGDMLPLDAYKDGLHIEAKNGDVELGQLMSSVFYLKRSKTYIEGKNVTFIGGGLGDPHANKEQSQFSIDAGNAYVKANGGNIDTTGFNPEANLSYDIRNANVYDRQRNAEKYEANYHRIQQEMREQAYLGNVRNKSGGLVLEAVADEEDKDTTGNVYLHDVVVEEWRPTATAFGVTGDMIIKGEHIIQKEARSGKVNRETGEFSYDLSKGTFIQGGKISSYYASYSNPKSFLISNQDIQMQNFYVMGGDLTATAKGPITVDLYTNNKENPQNTELVNNPEAFGARLISSQRRAGEKDVYGTNGIFNSDSTIHFGEIDLTTLNLTDWRSSYYGSITLNNKKDETDEDTNVRNIVIDKLQLAEKNRGYFYAQGDIALGEDRNTSHLIDGNGYSSEASLAIFESEEGSIGEQGELTVKNRGSLLMHTKAADKNIALDTLIAEKNAKIQLKDDAYNSEDGSGMVTMNKLGLHTGSDVKIWAKKSKGAANVWGTKIGTVEGDSQGSGSSLGTIHVYDTNLYMYAVTGAARYDLYRSDEEGTKTYSELQSNDWVPNGTKGLTVYAGSIGRGSNVLGLTLSINPLESDYLYAGVASEDAQTLSVKNYAGLTRQMKANNRKRVPFATIFDDRENQSQVAGTPESWYGRIARQELKIVKYKYDQWASEPYGYQNFHKTDNGKMVVSAWNDYMQEYGVENLNNAYTYYLEMITTINETAIGSFEDIVRQQWILANDMEPDVDQLNGSFRGAKYSGDSFAERKDGERPIRKGLWGRYNRNEYVGNLGGMTSNIYEIGVDNAWKVGDGIGRMGISAEYTKSGGRVGNSGGSHEKYTQGAVRLYDMWFGNKGHYYNLMFKAGAGRTDYDYTNEGEKYNGKYDRNVVKVSFEYGRKKDLWKLPEDQKWTAYIIPQFQFQYAHQEGTSFVTNDGITVSMTPTDSALLRVGFQYGFERNRGGGRVQQWFLRANLYREFLGKESLRIEDDTDAYNVANATFTHHHTVLYRNGDYRGTWAELGIGTNVKFSRDVSMYFDGSYYLGDSARKKYSLNLGFDFRV